MKMQDVGTHPLKERGLLLRSEWKLVTRMFHLSIYLPEDIGHCSVYLVSLNFVREAF